MVRPSRTRGSNIRSPRIAHPRYETIAAPPTLIPSRWTRPGAGFSFKLLSIESTPSVVTRIPTKWMFGAAHEAQSDPVDPVCECESSLYESVPLADFRL